MSLWRHERVMAWLAPSALVLALVQGRGSRERLLAQASQALDPPRDTRDWGACVAACAAQLKRLGWQRTELRVCVSDHFVRYALLAWREGLRGVAEWEAYARHELQTRYGTPDRPRTIRIASARAGVSRLAAAIDTELVGAMQRIAHGQRLTLAALEPNLCRVANRFRHDLPHTGAALAVSEPGRLSLLHARNDGWTDLASVRAARTPVETLVSLILQARIVSDAACRKLMFWGELADESDMLVRHGIDSTRLGPAPAPLPKACLALGLL